MSQVEVAFVIFDLFEIWRRSSRSPPSNILTPADFFQGAQTIVNSLRAYHNNIWRTQTNTMETIEKAKRLEST